MMIAGFATVDEGAVTVDGETSPALRRNGAALDGVPELRDFPASRRVRECRVSAAGAPLAGGADPRARRLALDLVPLERFADRYAASFGRPAAACAIARAIVFDPASC